jgi:DNA-binding transcriptional LysR family regulator
MQPSIHELRPLAHFVRVADSGSLTRAAIALDVSVSILSREMQELESSLGYAVFLRTGRGVRLTDLGRELYPRVKEFLVAASRLSEDARALGGSPSGTVSVGLPGTVAEVLAAPLYEAVRRHYPKIFLQLSEGLSAAIDELLTVGRIDIGLFFTDATTARPHAQPLCAVELVLVGPPGDKLTSKDTIPLKRLGAIPLILPTQPHALRRRI